MKQVITEEKKQELSADDGFLHRAIGTLLGVDVLAVERNEVKGDYPAQWQLSDEFMTGIVADATFAAEAESQPYLDPKTNSSALLRLASRLQDEGHDTAELARWLAINAMMVELGVEGLERNALLLGLNSGTAARH